MGGAAAGRRGDRPRAERPGPRWRPFGGVEAPLPLEILESRDSVCKEAVESHDSVCKEAVESHDSFCIEALESLDSFCKEALEFLGLVLHGSLRVSPVIIIRCRLI